MATKKEPVEESSDPIKDKKWVFKVSIHCEGCKKKVKKILSHVPGVREMEFDLKQQRVTVIGDIDPDALLWKLKKSGKQAEFWPEKKPANEKEKKPGKSKEQEKLAQPEKREDSTENSAPKNHNNAAVESPAQPETAEVPKEPAEKNQIADGADGGAAKSDEANGVVNEAKGTENGAKVSANEKKAEEESNSEKKQPETRGDGGEQPVAAEKKGGGEKGEGGNGGKKKKKKGQNGNNTPGEPSLSDAAPDQAAGPPKYSLPANHIPARGHVYYGYQPDLYRQPPVYAASYNTTYPGTYTSSYYSAPPANAYVYSYTGPEVEGLPLDGESYPRQPLDSFEMFSDENPNGCSVV